MKRLLLYALLFIFLLFMLYGCNSGSASKAVEPSSQPVLIIEDDKRFMTFPGLEWGMTAEEVINALALEDGSYVTPSEPTNLLIQDLRIQIFGVPNASVNFSFLDPNNDGVYSLDSVRVYFPQDTDMEPIKKELTNLYGDADDITEYRTIWHSDAVNRDILPQSVIEYLEFLDDYHKSILTESVSTVTWSDSMHSNTILDGAETTNSVIFSSNYLNCVQEGVYRSDMEAAGWDPTQETEETAPVSTLSTAPVPSYPGIDTYLMQFPGLQYGMTPEEVIAALSLEEGDYAIRTEGENYLTISQVRMNVFDTENASVGLNFQDYNGDGIYTLLRVIVLLPADTDMDAVKLKMLEQYGDASESSDTTVKWYSSALQQEFMTEEEIQLVSSYSNVGRRVLTDPVTTVILTSKYYSSFELDGKESANVLTFNSQYGFYTMEGGYLPQLEAAREPLGITQESNLCYPDLQWNMTPEEVMKQLGRTAEGCTALAEEEDSYIFSLEELPLFDQTVTGIFEFEKKAGDAFGLAYVYVLLPDSTGMTAIRSAMTMQLGDGLAPPNLPQDDRALYWDSQEATTSYLDAINPNRVTMPGMTDLPCGRIFWTTDFATYFSCFGKDVPEWKNIYKEANMVVFAGYVTQWMQYVEFGYPGTN